MRTVASSSLGFATCLSKNPDFSQSSELPLFTKGLRFYPKIRNNADAAKRFWKINAVRPINKGNSRKFEESPIAQLLEEQEKARLVIAEAKRPSIIVGGFTSMSIGAMYLYFRREKLK